MFYSSFIYFKAHLSMPLLLLSSELLDVVVPSLRCFRHRSGIRWKAINSRDTLPPLRHSFTPKPFWKNCWKVQTAWNGECNKPLMWHNWDCYQLLNLTLTEANLIQNDRNMALKCQPAHQILLQLIADSLPLAACMTTNNSSPWLFVSGPPVRVDGWEGAEDRV